MPEDHHGAIRSTLRSTPPPTKATRIAISASSGIARPGVADGDREELARPAVAEVDAEGQRDHQRDGEGDEADQRLRDEQLADLAEARRP